MSSEAAAVGTQAIAGFAIIGRTNEPIFFKTFTGGSDDFLRMQLAAFAALDAVDEKLALRKSGRLADSSKDPFLGILIPVEEHKIFGYITSTQVKLLLIVRDVLLREDKLRELFRAAHRLYVDAVCNPFSPLDGPLSSPRFDEALTRMLETAHSTILYNGPLPV